MIIPRRFTAEAITPSHNKKDLTMITIEIPQESRFDLPEGVYRARIDKLKPFTKQTGRGSQDWIRILFEVYDVPGISERWIAMAGKNFKLDLNHGSELRNFLTGLLGKDYFRENAGTKADLSQLEGMECEIELKHVITDDPEKPFVNVVNIRPVSLKKGVEQG